jgi:hypothetical protein
MVKMPLKKDSGFLRLMNKILRILAQQVRIDTLKGDLIMMIFEPIMVLNKLLPISMRFLIYKGNLSDKFES